MRLYATEADVSWRQLLQEKDPVIQTEWGRRYEHAEGVRRNYGRAVQLYCAAAKRGHSPAQYWLGSMYAHGRGVKRDDALAAAWFRLAAAQGDTHAQKMLERVDDGTRSRTPVCRMPRGSYKAQWSRASARKRQRIEDLVHRLAPRYSLDPNLVLAVISAESDFDTHAVSHKNAQGLMQLMPQTADRFGVQDPMDPVQNLKGGMAYLRLLLDMYKNDVRLAVAAYNAGERAIEKFGGVPPYPETLSYLEKVISTESAHQ